MSCIAVGERETAALATEEAKQPGCLRHRVLGAYTPGDHVVVPLPFPLSRADQRRATAPW